MLIKDFSKEDFIERLRNFLKIAKERIIVKSISEGSVIVQSEIAGVNNEE